MDNAITAGNARGTGYRGFAIGLATGTLVGAAAALWFNPRTISAFRRQWHESSAALGTLAAEQYAQTEARVGAAAADLTKAAQGVRDEVADTVARAAHDVERFALAAKSGTTI
jgi:gas vesicle protein